MRSGRLTTHHTGLVALTTVFAVVAGIGLMFGLARRAEGTTCPPLTVEWDPDAPGHDQALAALATDIVVGRVEVAEGSIGIATPSSDNYARFYPGSMLRVEVLAVIKGALMGTVEVVYPNFSINHYQAASFDAPLHSGDTALLLIRRNDLDGRLYVHGFSGGYFLIDDEDERARLVARFEAAVAATPVASPSIASPVVSRPAQSPGMYQTEGQAGPVDDRPRVAAASDIFVGRVLTRANNVVVLEPGTPSAGRPATPVSATLYAVEVLDTLKGEATGTVLIRQQNDFNGYALASPRYGPPLLTPGDLAVFVASFETDTGWYTLKDGWFGHARIDGDPTRSSVVADFAALAGTPEAASPAATS